MGDSVLDSEPAKGYWMKRAELVCEGGQIVQYWRCLGVDCTSTAPSSTGDCRDWIRMKARELRQRFCGLHRGRK